MEFRRKIYSKVKNKRRIYLDRKRGIKILKKKNKVCEIKIYHERRGVNKADLSREQNFHGEVARFGGNRISGRVERYVRSITCRGDHKSFELDFHFESVSSTPNRVTSDTLFLFLPPPHFFLSFLVLVRSRSL